MISDPVMMAHCDAKGCKEKIRLEMIHDNYAGWGLADDEEVLLARQGWHMTVGGSHFCHKHRPDVEL